MTHLLTIHPSGRQVSVPHGANLLSALRDTGAAPDAPCGGAGTCGKCTVIIDGIPLRACSVTVDRDMTVTIPEIREMRILTAGLPVEHPLPNRNGYGLAFDIGTTTVAGALLSPEGHVLRTASARNPQASYGADVVSRIRAAMEGSMEALTAAIRNCLNKLLLELCQQANISPTSIHLVSVVGNPAMQQLFLGILPENLARPPFAPVLTRLEYGDAAPFFPCLSDARLLTAPDISGFVGADTLGCMLAVGMDTTEEMTLLVDIGTNGEIVLGNRYRMVSCSTAAGPALEGAQIHFGMSARPGAIDRVSIENGKFVCHVMGDIEARGICGSGIVSAVAAALELGLLNSRGKILNETKQIPLTQRIFLTQEDIRQVQLAKGAIAAGIRLLAKRMDLPLESISRVYLAGAFGTYLDPLAACRMGLLPQELTGKTIAIGNAALTGAQLLALDLPSCHRVSKMAVQTQDLNLSTDPDFPRTFASCMRFDTTL